jgi:hypothetical protein
MLRPYKVMSFIIDCDVKTDTTMSCPLFCNWFQIKFSTKVLTRQLEYGLNSGGYLPGAKSM